LKFITNNLRDPVYSRHDEIMNWYIKLKLQFHNISQQIINPSTYALLSIARVDQECSSRMPAHAHYATQYQ